VVRRAAQVSRVALGQVVVPWLRRDPASTGAQRAQQALEALGGTWVKLGQALALRFDLLPSDYCLGFFQLLNQVRPFPADAVRRTLEAELGRPVEACFRSFAWEPLAAASIGQVHRAVLPDGTEVAVKVQRPDVRELVRADLRLMRWAATLLDASWLLGPTDARALVAEFSRWTEEELDYRTEARHAAALRANAGGDALERNPRVVASHTTSRVLTLEYLGGVPVIEIVAAIRRGDEEFLAALRARGHDRRRIASHIVWNALNQIYRFGYFHADPHPANLIVLEGDAIGYVDFGIVGRLDDRTTSSLRYFAQSLFAGHVGNAVDEFMRFLAPSPRTDPEAARRDLLECMTRYLESARVAPQEVAWSEEVFEIEMLGLVRRHAMAIAPDAARYLKAVLTAEATVKELDPEFDLRGHENRFFGRLMLLEARESVNVRRVGQWILDARWRVERLLESVERLGEAPRHVLPLARAVRRRVQFLSLLTIFGWLAVLVALWTGPPEGPLVLGQPLRQVALGGVLASLVLLAFSVRQVRRLPSGSEPAHVSQYPRRVR
jgi:predicted unusual protein kinase regulating ubiquinone biosynthesis (AarF/ABC1/UbiB family)